MKFEWLLDTKRNIEFSMNRDILSLRLSPLFWEVLHFILVPNNLNDFSWGIIAAGKDNPSEVKPEAYMVSD